MNSVRRVRLRGVVGTIARWGVLLAVTSFLAACSQPQARPAAPPTVAPAGAGSGAASGGATQAAVSATDTLQFEPASVTVAKGATVTWRNTGGTAHTVTDDPGKAANKADAMLPAGAQPWDLGDLNAGQTLSHTFDTPGTYKYFCIPHEAAGMVATIVVNG